LDYVRDLHAGTIPPNVQVTEFFLDPGALLGVGAAQRNYVSTNYTHVTRDVAARGVNVIAQLVAKRTIDGRTEYSLGSNPDVTFDLLELLAPPNQRLGSIDYAIGLYGARLVREGGTLQIGIGELGDAVVYGLQLRQQQNGEFCDVLRNLKADQRFGHDLDSVGGAGPLTTGLYGCTEMFVDGFLDLYRTGVLRRRVYEDVAIQRLLNAGAIGERIDAAFLEALAGCEFPTPLTAVEFSRLQNCGVFRRDCRYRDGRIENSEGLSAPARFDSPQARSDLLAWSTARHLNGGVLLHGGFFLGPRQDRTAPTRPIHQLDHDGDAAGSRRIGRPGRRPRGERCRRPI
jgi:hypothetical protein